MGFCFARILREGLTVVCGVAAPRDAQFAYCAPSNLDTVVHDDGALTKYAAFLRRFAVGNTVVTVPNGGHASTYLSAQALQEWLSYTAIPEISRAELGLTPRPE